MCDHVTTERTGSQSGRAQAAGIQLIEKFPDIAPGLMFFGCKRHQATITLDTCRQNWDEAHSKRHPDDVDRRAACRSCPVGRCMHGNAATAGWADMRSRDECIRCGRTDLRIIGGDVCVSCWNRHRETLRGYNARGKPLLFPVTMTPRRVGLVVDGNPVYRRFLAWHEGEAVSRAIRQVDGAAFHGQQPAPMAWNARTRKFQYRCSKHPGELGTLREQVSADGVVEYICPVCTPGRARGLPEARVEAATSLADPEFVKQTLIATVESWQLTEFWTPTAHICDRCSHYAVQGRRRGNIVETRCPLCDAE